MRSSVGLGVFFLLLSPPLATGGPNALHTYSALELMVSTCSTGLRITWTPPSLKLNRNAWCS